jgi:hypothetical protein
MINRLGREQAERVERQIVPMMLYMRRLKDRLDAVRFERETPFYRVIVAAERALHSACLELHSHCCRTGIARPDLSSEDSETPPDRPRAG